jgi:hypothetical protein
LNQHKIIPSKQTLLLKNGKWDISLYKGEPLVYTNINDSFDICIDFPIINITFKDDLKLKYFRINTNGDEFFTKKITVGGRLFIKEFNSVTSQTQIDILKFYLFCAYRLTNYSIEVQSNNLFTLNLLFKMVTLDGEDLNTYEMLTKWMKDLYLQKTLDDEKPNSHDELFNWINNLCQMKKIDIISYDNIISTYIVSTSQLEYRKLDEIETFDERLFGITNFKEKLSLKDWVGNSAYDNLISWTIDFHLFHGLITNQDYNIEISKEIAINFIEIPEINISNKSCLKMIRPSTNLEVDLVSNNIFSIESISSFPFIKWDIEDYEGFSYILIKFERYEILLDEGNVKPTKEFEQIIEKALDSMKPLEDLQCIFDEYGHIFPQRIILGRSLKIILPTSLILNNTFENANDVNEILQLLDNLNVSYLITQKGERVEKDNLSHWIKDTNDNLEVIEFDNIIPLYKILKVEQQERIDEILNKFNDQNSRIIMTGITNLKDLNNESVIHYKCIDVETPLEDENYEVFGSIISEDNIRLDNVCVNFGLYDFNGFYAIIRKSEIVNIDLRKCYISWMVVGKPSQLSVFCPNNRDFQVNYFNESIKLRSNQSNYCIKTFFNLSEGYTIFAHAYHSPTNYEPNSIFELVKWTNNSITFQVTNMSSLSNLDNGLTGNVNNIYLNICILSTDYESLKIGDDEEKERFLVGYILTKENFCKPVKENKC